MRVKKEMPDVLNTEEVCMYLRCSDKTVREFIAAGRLPGAYRMGTAWRYPKEDVIKLRTDLAFESQSIYRRDGEADD